MVTSSSRRRARRPARVPILSSTCRSLILPSDLTPFRLETLSDMASLPGNEYERQRLANIANNQALLAGLFKGSQPVSSRPRSSSVPRPLVVEAAPASTARLMRLSVCSDRTTRSSSCIKEEACWQAEPKEDQREERAYRASEEVRQDVVSGPGLPQREQPGTVNLQGAKVNLPLERELKMAQTYSLVLARATETAGEEDPQPAQPASPRQRVLRRAHADRLQTHPHRRILAL